MKKKQMFSIIFIAVVFLLVSCKTKDYVTPDETAQMQSTAIMDCILEQDAKALKELFCQHIKDTHPNIEEEILELLRFIDGEIISYDMPEGNIKSKSTTEAETIKQELTGYTRNIKTTNGKTYEIGFNSYYIYAENEGYIGVSIISIIDVDAYDEKVGYPDEGVSVIGEVL